MSNGWLLLCYAVPLLVALWAYRRRSARAERANRDALARTRRVGVEQPISLHPVINPNRCMGCGACTRACPQGDVLGVIAGQAELINPTHCIGHGRCAASCPTDAIRLAIGTEERGVDLPVLDGQFQTTTPGIFVAGELGGMGLIRNAVEQGRQAIRAVSELASPGRPDQLDVVIVGAGPAGFAASLAAKEQGLRYLTLEQDVFGGAIAHHPRGKVIVTEPVHLPLLGKVKIRETHKEWLLDFWKDARQTHGLQIEERTRVDAVAPTANGFLVEAAGKSLATRAVLLAVGRRGTPRKLNVAGEERSSVVYGLADPEQYRDRRVLVVGGGDSALEAVLSLARVEGCRPTLSYRGKEFSRPRPATVEALAAEREAGRLEVLLETEVARIEADAVELRGGLAQRKVACDAVIVCTGGDLPNDFLRAAGVAIETAHGEPLR